MNSEVLKAAERLRQVNAGISDKDKIRLYGTSEQPKMRLGKWGHYEALELANAWVVGDCETLADAYLTQNPADDNEAITEEWLRSIGFTEYGTFMDGWGGHEGGLRRGDLEWHCKRDWRLSGCVCGAKAKTRGDVRRLCAALGIRLKAPEPERAK